MRKNISRDILRFVVVTITLLSILSVTFFFNVKSSLACIGNNTYIYEGFSGKTFFKDQFPWAKWYRWTTDLDDAQIYKNMSEGLNRFIRVGVNENASSNHVTFAEISMTEVNNPNANFFISENSRVEARMRYSPNIKADRTATGQTGGSAGMLFWDYHFGEIDYENKEVPVPNDAFGFVWQEPGSMPNSGFWISNVADGQAGNYVYYPNIDLSEWHTYAIERRHETMTYFIDGQQVHVEQINQEGTIQLPADQKLTVDFWTDNMNYLFDLSTYEFTINFRDLTESSWIDVDYFTVTPLYNW